MPRAAKMTSSASVAQVYGRVTCWVFPGSAEASENGSLSSGYGRWHRLKSSRWRHIGRDAPAVFQCNQRIVGAPRGIRTLVPALRGLCPGPLDDGSRENGTMRRRHVSLLLYEIIRKRQETLP